MIVSGKKIHYHSDCPFFAGCENMLANFLQDEGLRREFEVSFSYRYSKKYEEGLRSRVKSTFKEYPMTLVCEYDLMGRSSILFKILYVIVPIKYLVFCWNFVKLFSFFRNNKVDLLHVNNGGYPAASSAQAAVIAAKFSGIKKIVYVVNNVASTYRSPIRWYDYPIDFFVKRFVDCFVTGSIFAGDKLLEVLKLSKSKWQKIHNGVAMRAVVENRRDVRKRLSISDERVVIGNVALFEERKGHIYLVKSMELLKREMGDACPLLLLEGDGPLKENIEKYVKESSLVDVVKFVGNERYVFDFINALDIFVLPSIRNEDFPNVILEAMSLACPVIATRIAGVPEQVAVGETGFVIQPMNVEVLASMIKQLVNDADQRSLMGKSGKRRFDDLFTVSISIEQYKILYRSLIL